MYNHLGLLDVEYIEVNTSPLGLIRMPLFFS